MQTIDAINDMLSYIGESPLDPTDTDYQSHPLYESANRILERVSRLYQSRGWWFNRAKTTLTPVANAIAMPAGTLTFQPLLTYGVDYAIRDDALYNMTDDTATISVPVTGYLTKLIDFEQLPESAAAYVTALASVRFVKTYDGDAAKEREAKEDRDAAYMLMNADHIRNSKVNVFDTASMGPVLANTWYIRYQR